MSGIGGEVCDVEEVREWVPSDCDIFAMVKSVECVGMLMQLSLKSFRQCMPAELVWKTLLPGDGQG